MKEYTLLFSTQLNQLFPINNQSDFKFLLIDSFGQNLPSKVVNNKNKVLCDKSVLNYISEIEHDEYGNIGHYCVKAYGRSNSIYDWDKLIKAISTLTFISVHKATPWTGDDYDHFYAVNRKRLKKWFKQNHNRFLSKKTSQLKYKLSECF